MAPEPVLATGQAILVVTAIPGTPTEFVPVSIRVSVSDSFKVLSSIGYKLVDVSEIGVRVRQRGLRHDGPID